MMTKHDFILRGNFFCEKYISFKLSYYNKYKSYLREWEANNVINSLNCDGFDIGSRCSLNLPDLR